MCTVGYQHYCTNCGQQFWPTTLGETLCWQCMSGNIVFHDYSHSFATAIVQIYTGSWEEWNYLFDGITYFMYVIEDGWFTWTEAKDMEQWAKGIIYKTKNFFDFIEYLVTFTGSRGPTATMTITGSDGVNE